MNKVITFGEILMRLSTQNGHRFSQTNSLDVCFGGAEFNVAASLANYGIPVELVTCLPNNDLGKRALMEIRKQNVATNHILFGRNRLGIYFLEEGSSVRASQVIYDRAESAIAQIKLGTIDWKSIFSNATHFHWSGITPAISQTAAEVCLEALKFAHQAGITISCDLNYRSKLWKYGKDPKEIMLTLLQYCSIILGDIDTALFMLGESKINPDYTNTASLAVHYNQIMMLCPNLQKIATTIRYAISSNHQEIGGILYDGKQIYSTPVQTIFPVLDRIGTGDAFMGGLLYGFLNGSYDNQQALEFAVAACRLKHTIKGDVHQATVAEVLQLIKDVGSANISR